MTGETCWEGELKFTVSKYSPHSAAGACRLQSSTILVSLNFLIIIFLFWTKADLTP